MCFKRGTLRSGWEELTTRKPSAGLKTELGWKYKTLAGALCLDILAKTLVQNRHHFGGLNAFEAVENMFALTSGVNETLLSEDPKLLR